MILLDTHAAIWILRDDAALGKKARGAAVAALADAQLAISAISFWEIALLIAKAACARSMMRTRHAVR